jgi:hypothetical protein
MSTPGRGSALTRRCLDQKLVHPPQAAGVTHYRCVSERLHGPEPSRFFPPLRVRSLMAIVAELFEHVVGIDTHARTHTYCLVACATGAVVDAATFPASKAGHARAIRWILRRTRGSVLAAIEGTSSYGAGITAALVEGGFDVTEDEQPSPRGSPPGGPCVHGFASEISRYARGGPRKPKQTWIDMPSPTVSERPYQDRVDLVVTASVRTGKPRKQGRISTVEQAGQNR